MKKIIACMSMKICYLTSSFSLIYFPKSATLLSVTSVFSPSKFGGGLPLQR